MAELVAGVLLAVGTQALGHLCCIGIDSMMGLNDADNRTRLILEQVSKQDVVLRKMMDKLGQMSNQLTSVESTLEVLGYMIVYGQDFKNLQYLIEKFLQLKHDNIDEVKKLMKGMFNSSGQNYLPQIMENINQSVCKKRFGGDMSMLDAFRAKNSCMSQYWSIQYLCSQLLSMQLCGYVMWEKMQKICRASPELSKFCEEKGYFDSTDVRKFAQTNLKTQSNLMHEALNRCSSAIVNASMDKPFTVAHPYYFDSRKVSTSKPIKGVRFFKPWANDDRINVEIKYWDVDLKNEPSVGPLPQGLKERRLAQDVYEKRCEFDMYNDEREPYMSGCKVAHTYMNRVPYPEMQVVTGVQIQWFNEIIGLSIDYKMRGESRLGYQHPRHWRNNDPTYPGETTGWPWERDGHMVDFNWVDMEYPGWCTGVGIYRNSKNQLAFRMEVRYS